LAQILISIFWLNSTLLQLLGLCFVLRDYRCGMYGTPVHYMRNVREHLNTMFEGFHVQGWIKSNVWLNPL